MPISGQRAAPAPEELLAQFGLDAFRPGQREAVEAALEGRDSLVVMPTGGGKSTIMSLIPRFYDPSAGAVRVDGIDVRDYRLQALRDQIGYVLQETVLFRGTVRDNIAYGRAGATDEPRRSTEVRQLLFPLGTG